MSQEPAPFSEEPAPLSSSTTNYERDLALRRYDTVMKFLGTEIQVYWTRSQLFLVAHTALLGFGLKEIAVSNDASEAKVLLLLVASLAGVTLCVLWHRGLTAGEGWMEHWKKALRKWEDVAFEENLFRERPCTIPISRHVARSTAWLFTLLWALVTLYLTWRLLSTCVCLRQS